MLGNTKTARPKFDSSFASLSMNTNAITCHFQLPLEKKKNAVWKNSEGRVWHVSLAVSARHTGYAWEQLWILGMNASFHADAIKLFSFVNIFALGVDVPFGMKIVLLPFSSISFQASLSWLSLNHQCCDWKVVFSLRLQRHATCYNLSL